MGVPFPTCHQVQVVFLRCDVEVDGQNKLNFVHRIVVAKISVYLYRHDRESLRASRSGTCSVGLLRGSKREEGRESSDAVEESDAQLALHSCRRAGEQTD